MNRSSSDKAYDAIHEMISSGTISPGQQLVESVIATSLGMSRTPVREALRRLQQDGLVEIIPNKGCFLKRLDLRELADSYEIVALLSSMACRHLALDADTLDPAAMEGLFAMVRSMEDCLEAKRTREWLEMDIQFHQRLIQMTNIQMLCAVYDNLSLHTNQILWLITPFFIDCSVSTSDHRQLLSMIADGKAEEVSAFVKEHHMRTAEIIRKLDDLKLSLSDISVLT